MTSFEVKVIGRVESPLTDLDSAPRQPDEGAPAAWLVFEPEMLEGLRSVRPGDEVLVITWLDRARRDVLSVHPRGGHLQGEGGRLQYALSSSPESHRPASRGDHRYPGSPSAGTQSRSVGWDADHRRQADTQRRHQPTLSDGLVTPCADAKSSEPRLVDASGKHGPEARLALIRPANQSCSPIRHVPSSRSVRPT